MNKLAQGTAIVFVVFYLVCAGLGFAVDLGNASDHCDTYASGPAADGTRIVSINAEGTTEKHLVSRDEGCFYFYTQVIDAARAVASFPVSPVFLIGCFEGSGCSSVVIYGLVSLLGLVNALCYGLAGFIIGTIISLPFQRTSKR